MSLLLLFAGAGISASQRDIGWSPDEEWTFYRRKHHEQIIAIQMAEIARREAIHADVQNGIERRARESFRKLQAEQARRNEIRKKLRGK